MYKTTVKIDGMMCGMCEVHINDSIRKKIEVKKIVSSHKKGETVIISKNSLTREEIEAALADSGYKVTGFVCGTYEKKGLFGR
ncbi:MAG: heavy-metal-associated domain-containing protein [Ruminococcus sp.]|jgi:copper chaperone CopZ|uniref:ATPase P n=1 Tax=Ruminococcus albus SY3 TaxID=1341156 RepID=A0A011WSI3_RUMAL|nr:heavy metal-associated domain-containing protein [Ruminococcus albus]EXM39965.1 ATPase P [Ruminococcus albus SY3]MBE6870041.1 heavy-metal-associated domain-containing protein [Ruminococcus albus]MBP5268078.1 heavy-metal-associated domain-containing protein [Ruminococcus sp.]